MERCKYLCSRIDKDEWVGVPLCYTSGSLQDETLKIEVIDIYPIYHAHGMTFDGDYNYDLNYAIDNNYDIEVLKIGLIHSHCNATTFFSQSDMNELKENAKFHNYYISLITNNNNNWCGKIAVNETYTYRKIGYKIFYDSKGDKISQNFTEEVSEDKVKIYDCDIYVEQPNIDEQYIKLVDKIIRNKAKINTKSSKDLIKEDSRNWNTSYHWIDWDADTLKEDSIVSDELFSMFITGTATSIPLHHLAVITEYDKTTMGPYHLFDYLEKFWGALSIEDKEEAVETVLNMFENLNTKFAKEIKKDYEKYAIKVFGS